MERCLFALKAMAKGLRSLPETERYLKIQLLNGQLSHEVNVLHAKGGSLTSSLALVTRLSLLHKLKLYEVLMASAAKYKHIWKWRDYCDEESKNILFSVVIVYVCRKAASTLHGGIATINLYRVRSNCVSLFF